MFDIKERCANTHVETGIGKRQYLEWPQFFVGITGIAAACNLIAAIGCLYTIVSVLSNPATRSNTFNLYVVFLLFPDSLNAFVNFLFCFHRIKYCGYIPHKILQVFFDFNTFFYYFCNFSLNSILAWEVTSMLGKARRLRRTGPPSMKRTLLGIVAAYSFALLFCGWGMVDAQWSWWHRERHAFGSPPGGLFSELQAIAMVAGLMLTFMIFIVAMRIRIWRKRLLPKRGRTRAMSIFLGRIVVVFLVFYFPTVALLMVSAVLPEMIPKFTFSTAYFWIERSLQFLTALQVFTTLFIVYQKPDIRNAVLCGQKPGKIAAFCDSWKNCGFRRTTAQDHSNKNQKKGARQSSVTIMTQGDDPNPRSRLTSQIINETFAGESSISDPNAKTEWDMTDVYSEYFVVGPNNGGVVSEEIVFDTSEPCLFPAVNEESGGGTEPLPLIIEDDSEEIVFETAEPCLFPVVEEKSGGGIKPLPLAVEDGSEEIVFGMTEPCLFPAIDEESINDNSSK